MVAAKLHCTNTAKSDTTTLPTSVEFLHRFCKLCLWSGHICSSFPFVLCTRAGWHCKKVPKKMSRSLVTAPRSGKKVAVAKHFCALTLFPRGIILVGSAHNAELSSHTQLLAESFFFKVPVRGLGMQSTH